MRWIVLPGCILGGLSMLSGCISTADTRLPTLFPRHPTVEKRASELFDPYPDSLAGPGTNQRPLGFGLPRTEPRRDLELRALRLRPMVPGQPSSALPPPPHRRYSNAVQP